MKPKYSCESIFERLAKIHAVLSKLSQFMVLQGFAMYCKWTFARILKCKNHGFSQGFAMGTLLMKIHA